ncbi:MAG: response regulator [Polaromonas sp.]|nr:response regulator [Polaromonas sp.]
MVELVELVELFQPRLALPDIGLPVMNGYELSGRLRQHPGSAAMHLVAITGHGQKGDIKLAPGAGFDEHFGKPIDIDLLGALLARVDAGARVLACPLAQTAGIYINSGLIFINTGVGSY